MRRSRGFRNKTRRTLRKTDNHRITITERLKNIALGSRVIVKLESSVHDGMPHPRYHGIFGKIIEKRGNAYVLSINDKNKPKTLIAAPEHLKVMKD